MKTFILFELIILLEFLPGVLGIIFGYKMLWLLPLIAVAWTLLVRAFMREEKERCLYMNKKKYVAASDAAEIISEKLSVPIGDLVDIFAEIPSAPAFECKHCGKAIRFPVAFHSACYELAVGSIMEKVCDKYCRFPCECKSQEELDKHCDSCELMGSLLS